MNNIRIKDQSSDWLQTQAERLEKNLKDAKINSQFAWMIPAWEEGLVLIKLELLSRNQPFD